jgi:integrase
VVQTLQRIDGELRFVPPKTERSARTVPLQGVCERALREHRARQAAERLAASEEWVDSGLVFTTTVGPRWSRATLRRSWYPLRRAIGEPELRFHDLRHTCVTLPWSWACRRTSFGKFVGHSDIQVTMTIYAHASLDEKRRALTQLDDGLA